jgi:Predicted ATPase (AAA+ superfamily)
MNAQAIADIEAGMQRRMDAMPALIRPFTSEKAKLPRACIVTGPRGVGKSTFLLHHARGSNLLYVSADHPRFSEYPLYDIVKSIFLAGYAGVIVDEVHYARDWSQQLKALYDDYPDRSLWISDSSSLVLRSGVGDLSRRYLPIRMPLLSFREFLFLETGRLYPVYDPLRGETELPLKPSAKILAAFRSFRMVGSRPFYTEGDFEDRLLAVLDKSLYADIPFFLPGVTDGNLRLMKAIIGTLAGASVPRLQVRSLCADWGIGAEKLYTILEVMESVGVLRIIRIEKDTKAQSVGQKLFFFDPAYYAVLRGNPGTACEALVASLCECAGWKVEASRDETAGDFVISRKKGKGSSSLALEIGGASKSKKSADFVVRDDIDYPSRGVIPLWLLGMSY